jgi:hypothetical protein
LAVAARDRDIVTPWDIRLDSYKTAFVLQELGSILALRASIKREADRGSLERIWISYEGREGSRTVLFERLDITPTLQGRLIEALGQVAQQLAEDLKTRSSISIDLTHVIDKSE